MWESKYFLFYDSCPISGSDCPRQTPLLAYPQWFGVDWYKYGHNTVRLNFLLLYWTTGFLVAPKGSRGGPGDCTILALGSMYLGTTSHTHTQILRHRRLLLCQCTYALILYKSSLKEEKLRGDGFLIKDHGELMGRAAECSFPVWFDVKTLENFLSQV